MLSSEDAAPFQAFLDRYKIRYSEAFDYAAFEGDPFFEVDDDPDEGYVAHCEVGWSWWEALQKVGLRTLGAEATPHLQRVFAWYGVAVPAEVPPGPLGPPQPMKSTSNQETLSVWEKLGLRKPKPVEDLMHATANRFSGGDEGLQVVSSLALEREIGALLKELKMEAVDPWELYNSVDDADDDATGKVMGAIAHKFLRAANARDYLVWFRK